MKYKNCFAKRLSRNQEEIKLYIQLGREYHIPYDILKISFREKYRCNLNYHQNIIIFTCLEYNSWPEVILNKCYEEQIFNYRIPDNRGIEWAIKQIEYEPGTWSSKERIARYDTLLKIKILGEEHYLLKNMKIKYEDDDIIVPADKKLIIKYLNVSPIDEIKFDYDTHIEWKEEQIELGIPHTLLSVSPFRLIIHPDGDSQYL